MTGILAVAALLATSLMGSAGSATAEPAGDSDSPSPIVQTDNGLLEGSTTGAVDKYLGIPFAAPPTGDLRWQPPAVAADWSGVRSATEPGPNCPQLSNPEANEDCLYLNVYRPSEQSDSPLPVMFWIHGGGFSSGSGSNHDGSLLAETNNMVVVTINYRLGAFGFLSLPGLSEEGAGNYGLLDQIAALRWTHDNIAAFGGDPSRTTISGLSAGGHSVCALLASPQATDLFAGAIMHSGGCPSHTVAEATADGEGFAADAGCSDAADPAACLRTLPADTVLEASRGLVGGILTGPLPVAGVPELPVAPDEAVRSGDYNNVPILLGSTRDEVRQWAAPLADATEEQYREVIRYGYGEYADEVLARYPMSSYPGPYNAAYALGAVWTDSSVFYGLGGCEYQGLATTFAEQQPDTFFYRFDDRTAPARSPLPGFDSGAPHGADGIYLWPGNASTLNPEQEALSLEMVKYWGAFVNNADPAVAGQADWAPYSSGDVMSLRLGGSTPMSAETFDADHHCSFWESIDYPWLTVNPSDLAEMVAEPVSSTVTASVKPAAPIAGKHGVTVDVAVEAADGSVPTGSVAIRVDGKRKGSGQLDSDGRAKVVLPAFARAGVKSIVARYTGTSDVGSSASAPVSIRVRKAPSTVKVKKERPKKIKRGKTRAKLIVKVAVVGSKAPKGRVQVKKGGKVLAKGKVNAKGRVKLTLPKFPTTGKKKVRVVYLGNGNIKQSRTVHVLRIVR